MKKILKAYNLLYIFVCIIWLPAQMYILKVDGAGRTILIMMVLAILLNLMEFWKQKKIFATPAFFCWVILFCYSMWNVFSKGFYAEYGTLRFLRVNFFDSFVLLLIMMLELKKNKQVCLWLIWIALGVYLIIGIPFFSIGEERFGVEGIGNLFPLHAVCFLFVSSLLLVENKIKIILYISICVIISVIILLSGTRKAFGAEAILLLGVVLNYGKKKNLWAWIRIGVFLGILLVGIYYVMNNTLVGERILSNTDSDFHVQLVENNKVNDFLMVLLGDRAIMYETGIELFHENFWTGIGLTNYVDMSGGELRLHSEYMVQLCENGIIGFFLLMFYYTVILIGLIRRRRGSEEKRQRTGMALFGFVSLLFLNLTCWTYCQKWAMVFYAIILMYAYFDQETLKIDTDKNENCSSSSGEKFQQTLDRLFPKIPNRI